MELVYQIVSIPTLSIVSLLWAVVYSFTNLIPFPDYDAAVWYFSRLVSFYGVVALFALALGIPVRWHPSYLRARHRSMRAGCVFEFINDAKIALACLALYRAFPDAWPPQWISLLMIYSLIFTATSYFAVLLGCLFSLTRGFTMQISDIYPHKHLQLIAEVLNPWGCTFVAVPREEQLYFEFSAPRTTEKTSGATRKTSVSAGGEGARRCEVLDEGPLFNHTVRGCLLSV